MTCSFGALRFPSVIDFFCSVSELPKVGRIEMEMGLFFALSCPNSVASLLLNEYLYTPPFDQNSVLGFYAEMNVLTNLMQQSHACEVSLLLMKSNLSSRYSSKTTRRPQS